MLTICPLVGTQKSYHLPCANSIDKTLENLMRWSEKTTTPTGVANSGLGLDKDGNDIFSRRWGARALYGKMPFLFLVSFYV